MYQIEVIRSYCCPCKECRNSLDEGTACILCTGNTYICCCRILYGGLYILGGRLRALRGYISHLRYICRKKPIVTLSTCYWRKVALLCGADNTNLGFIWYICALWRLHEVLFAICYGICGVRGVVRYWNCGAEEQHQNEHTTPALV